MSDRIVETMKITNVVQCFNLTTEKSSVSYRFLINLDNMWSNIALVLKKKALLFFYINNSENSFIISLFV